MTDYRIHLVGSIPLASATEVFKTVGTLLGPRIDRIPDGETGARSEWLAWLEYVFADNSAFEAAGSRFRAMATGRVSTAYRLRDGLPPRDLSMDNLRHADIAIESYREFARLQAAGEIPAACKYQFAFAHPLSVVRRFVVEEQQQAVLPVYEAALLAQVDKMARIIPRDRLAIQWDIASAVFATLHLAEPDPFGETKAEMHQNFAAWNARLGNAVPANIDLIFHLCYGSSGNRHSVEPVDLGDAVEQANRITEAITRPIQLFHMPVPVDRSDAAYFAPLRNLRLRPETKLSLGLIHDQDGVWGAAKRIASAEQFVHDFSIATECGFGRRAPETIPGLLRLHAELAGSAPRR